MTGRNVYVSGALPLSTRRSFDESHKGCDRSDCEVDGLPGELSWISSQVSGFKAEPIERQRLRYVNTHYE